MLLNKKVKRQWGILPDSMIPETSPFHEEILQIRSAEQRFLSMDPLDYGTINHLLDPDMEELEFLGLAGAVVFQKLSLTPFDEQYQGALALIRGQMIEMQTGEGKTVTAALASAWLAFHFGRSQVLTFNDYLATRDADWMKPVYQSLGLSVGSIQEIDPPETRRLAYQADIVYATAKSIGFDFLRNQMVWHSSELMPIDFRSVIVDEADAILIDEARHPLVLAGSQLVSPLDLKFIARLVNTLEVKEDYVVDERRHELYLTDQGAGKVQQAFPDRHLFEEDNQELLVAVHLALQARVLLHRDVHYIVKDDRIWLVDEFTGRVVPDRQWRNGLQAAVEAKEQVTIKADGNVLQMITIPHLIRKYERMAGMTATAEDVADELFQLYGIKTCIIPTHQPSRRQDLPLNVYLSKEEKATQILEEVQRRHQRRQPILIGTLTVEESEKLAEQLQAFGIPVQVLNAYHDAEEAQIIAKAALPGMVTIATNMAGRGTDIRLGNGDPVLRQEVVESGGLFVLGTNLHEARRIDRQLCGRAGRQGDPGETQFFVSMEDELMVRYHLREIMQTTWRKVDPAVMSGKKRTDYLIMVQKIIEKRLEEMRINIAEYADFLENQRILWYRERQQYLHNPSGLETLLASAMPERSEEIKAARHQLLEIILYHYDHYWSSFLQTMLLRRDGIHMVRMGGFQPLRVFREEADTYFEDMLESCREAVLNACISWLDRATAESNSHSYRRPSATWTYVASDNPFSDQLNIRLANPGEIALQTDALTLPLLFIKGLINRWKGRRKENMDI